MPNPETPKPAPDFSRFVVDYRNVQAPRTLCADCGQYARGRRYVHENAVCILTAAARCDACKRQLNPAGSPA